MALQLRFPFFAALLTVAFICAFVGRPTAVSARSLDEVLKSGEIRIGVNGLIPPRAQFNDKNELVGFEPDLANLLAKKLGVKLTLINVNGPDRVPYVASDRVDAVMGGLLRTSDRAKVIDFTVPIASDNYGVVARADTNVKTLMDLNRPEITIAMSRGNAILPTVKQLLPLAKIEIYDNIPDQDRAIAQGRAAATVDLIDNYNADKFYPDIKWTIFRAPEIPVMYSCVGVSKGNYTLRDWLNLALWELHSDGTIASLWSKWAGRPMFVPIHVSEYF